MQRKVNVLNIRHLMIYYDLKMHSNLYHSLYSQLDIKCIWPVFNQNSIDTTYIIHRSFDRKHIISHSKLYIDSYRRFLQLVTKGRKQSFSRTNMSKSRAFVIFTTSLTLHCIPAHLHRSTLWWIRQYSWSSNDKWVKFSLFVFNDNKLLIRETQPFW